MDTYYMLINNITFQSIWFKKIQYVFITCFCIFSFAPPSHSANSINWYDWQNTAFKQAQKSKKLIMVNVGHEGCIACRWMEERTFTDSGVISLLNQNFISIQVDSEARPDIGERYSDWAWPATAFMTPDGEQVLAIRGNRNPDTFTDILKKLIEDYAAGKLKADELAPYAAMPNKTNTPLTDIRKQVREQLDESFDQQRGGWGGDFKIIEYSEPVLQYLIRYHLDADTQSKQRAIKTIKGFAQQTDPVWGGMYYGSFGQWDNAVREKRLESQAAGLQMFAEGYAVTKDPVFKNAMENIFRFLTTMMYSKDGAFYSNQKDQVPGLPEGKSTDDYFALDDAGRRQIGLPVIDHSIYTSTNARVIVGMVRAYEVTGDDKYLAVASKAANFLLATRLTKEGWIIQHTPDSAMQDDQRIHHILPTKTKQFLRPQGYFGEALLALYRATADKQWLTTAIKIADNLKNLEDTKLGGFYGSSSDGTEEFIARRKPLEDNSVAARFTFLLGVYTKNEELKKSATKALLAAAAPPIVSREGKVVGNLAVALEIIINNYVEFTVVGQPTDPAAKALYAAGLQQYEPRKVLHYENAGRYPQKNKAAMYICNDTACSVPIFDPAKVSLHAALFVNGDLHSK